MAQTIQTSHFLSLDLSFPVGTSGPSVTGL